MALTKKKKVAVGLLALVGVATVVGVAAASGKRSSAAPDDDDDDDDDASPSVLTPPTASEGIDLDALPDRPEDDDDDDDDDPASDVVSPGWPQPSNGAPPSVTLPIPGIINTGGSVTPPVQLPVDVVIPPSAIPVDLPSVIPPTVTLPPVTIPPVMPQVPALDTVGLNLTNAMVTELKAAERTRNWKRPYDSVAAWQQHFGRPVDSKFGPGDGLFLATLTGNVPVVRYWPAKDGVNPKRALQDYKAGLTTIASSKSGVHADQLRASIARERGQSFGPPTGTGGQAPIM